MIQTETTPSRFKRFSLLSRDMFTDPIDSDALLALNRVPPSVAVEIVEPAALSLGRTRRAISPATGSQKRFPWSRGLESRTDSRDGGRENVQHQGAWGKTCLHKERGLRTPSSP